MAATLLQAVPQTWRVLARTCKSRTSLRMLSTSTSPSKAATSQDSATTSSLPYRVGRSAGLNLPVYHRIKSGGTNRTTEVKKVEGDARVLSEQLAMDLQLETRINTRTNHVIIKVYAASTMYCLCMNDIC